MATKHFSFWVILTFLLSLSGLSQLAAQRKGSQPNENTQSTPTQPNLYGIGKYADGKVLLRWAPVGPEFWKAANTAGYHVERLVLPENVDALSRSNFQRLTARPLKPAPVEDWEAPAETDDAVAAAYMTLYAPQPEFPAADMFTQMKQQSDLQDNAYFMAMSAAELSAQAARLLGLRFEDETAQPGERYLSRIFAAAPLAGASLDTALVFVVAETSSEPLVPTGVETLSDEMVIYVKWELTANRSKFFAYHIERSQSPNGPFTRLNRQPLLYLNNDELGAEAPVQVYTDSVGVNYKPFYYRIIGITPFAELSQPSEVVMGMARDRTPPLAPAIREAVTKDGKTAYLRWDKETIEPDMAGFIVARGEHPEGPFTALHEGLLPTGRREFTDRNPEVEGRNFYTVIALDTAGNEARSLSAYVLFEDKTPPAPPVGLTGTVDTNGVVRLHWSPNREADLMGYRVYWANDPGHKFIMISTAMVTDTTFTDTISINTLTEHVYYRIAAVDNGFGHSDFSEMLELKRPDVVPPSPGLFSDYTVSEKGVELSWIPSSSADLASQQLLRRQPGGEWVLVKTFDKNADRYVDEITSGGAYEYALRAVDDDGLQSELSFPLGVVLSTSKGIPPVEGLRAVYFEEKNTLELQWRYPNATNRRFVIYRSVNGGGLTSYESVSGAVAFADAQLPGKGTYAYAVRVVDDATGRESELRETGSVNVQ